MSKETLVPFMELTLLLDSPEEPTLTRYQIVKSFDTLDELAEAAAKVIEAATGMKPGLTP